MLSGFFGGDNQAGAANNNPGGLSDNWKNALQLLSIGLLAKGQNPDTPLMDIFAANQKMTEDQKARAQEQKKQAALQQLAGDMMKSPYLQDDSTRGMVRDLVAAGMPEKAYDYLNSLKPKPQEPFTLTPGSARYDATGKLVASVPVQATKSEIQKSLESAGYKPGTPEYKQKIDEYYTKSATLGGTGLVALDKFTRQVAADNPDLDQNSVMKLANAYISGNQYLDNGTQVRPITPIAGEVLNQIKKAGSTSALITQGVRSNQGEAELKVLNDYANEGLKPYGTTYAGLSPTQILDTFKTDEQSQKRLGKFIASQALAFEAAQQRIKLAQGQPGVTSTEELIKMSQQTIDAKYPRLSQEARQEATRYMDEALSKGLQARNQIGIGAASATKNQTSDKIQLSNDRVPMIFNGQPVLLRADQVDEALKTPGWSRR